MAPITYFGGGLWIALRVHPNAFDGNPCVVENPLVHIAGTPWGEGETADATERTSKFVRCREYRPSAAYVSEFAQTLLESSAGRIETIEGLKLLKWSAGEGDVAAHFVQIVNKPQ